MIPPKANAAFVAAMEDVLDVYTRPHEAARPRVCLDETSKQLIAETPTGEPIRPGQPARHEYEYRRNGTGNLCMRGAPLVGWRRVELSERRTVVVYAYILRLLSDVLVPRGPDTRPGADELLCVASPSLRCLRRSRRLIGSLAPSSGAARDSGER